MAPFENDAPPADEEPRWGSRRQFGDTATASLVFAFVLMGVLCWIAILPAPMRVSNIATFARYHGVVATAVEMGLDVPYVEALTGMDASTVGLHALAAKVAMDVRAAKTAQTSAAAMRLHLTEHISRKMEQQRALQRAQEGQREGLRKRRPGQARASASASDPSAAGATTDALARLNAAAAAAGGDSVPEHLDLTPEELAAIKVEQQRAIRRARKSSFTASGRRKSPFRGLPPEAVAAAAAEVSQAPAGLRVKSATRPPPPPPLHPNAARPVVPARGHPPKRRSSGLGKRGKTVLRAATQQVKPEAGPHASAKQIMNQLNSGSWLFGGALGSEEAAALAAAAAPGGTVQLRHLEYVQRTRLLRQGEGEITDWAGAAEGETEEAGQSSDGADIWDGEGAGEAEGSELLSTELSSEGQEEGDESSGGDEEEDSTGEPGVAEDGGGGSSAADHLEWMAQFLGWARLKGSTAAAADGADAVTDFAAEAEPEDAWDLWDGAGGAPAASDARGDGEEVALQQEAAAGIDDASEEDALMGRIRVIRRIYGDGVVGRQQQGAGDEQENDADGGSDTEEGAGSTTTTGVVVVRRRARSSRKALAAR